MEDTKPSTRVNYTSDEKAPRYDVVDSETSLVLENVDDLKRRLTGRQMQMIAIGGSIGTALFVSIGSGLVQGGPGSLFIAFLIYCFFLAAVNNCMAEMAVFMPVSGSFIRMGSKWVDEAFGFMLGVRETSLSCSRPIHGQNGQFKKSLECPNSLQAFIKLRVKLSRLSYSELHFLHE